jgi:hypothetical protein
MKPRTTPSRLALACALIMGCHYRVEKTECGEGCGGLDVTNAIEAIGHGARLIEDGNADVWQA